MRPIYQRFPCFLKGRRRKREPLARLRSASKAVCFINACSTNVYRGGGVCVSKEGYIVTAAHCVVGEGEEIIHTIMVRFHGEEANWREAKVLATYPHLDLAIIRLVNARENQVYVKIPKTINLDWEHPLVAHGNVPTPFSSSIGWLAYPFPRDTLFPDLLSPPLSYNYNGNVPTDGHIASFKSYYMPGGSAFNLHPDLPLLLSLGTDSVSGWSGSPIFSKKDATFLGICLLGSITHADHILPSPVIYQAINLLKSGLAPPEVTVENLSHAQPGIRRRNSLILNNSREDSAYNQHHVNVEHTRKLAAVRASSSTVRVAVHFRVDLCSTFQGHTEMAGPPPKEAIFFGSGIILECSTKSDSEYLCSILAPASLFKQRPGDEQIQIDVHSSGGILYHGELTSCDFHYNCAIIAIVSTSPLPTLALKRVVDVMSTVSTMNLPTLHPDTVDSHPFNLTHGTPIVSVSIKHVKPHSFILGSGTLCLSKSKKFSSCNELYQIEDGISLDDGAPVLNSMGDIIGVVFDSSSFLPSNIILRWWTHYKSFGGFCRPFIGMEVIDLHEANIEFLAQFTSEFPAISTALVVTKVEKGSPAYLSGIVPDDVIVKFENNAVDNRLEFCEALWDKVGKTVAVTAIRMTNGIELSVSLVVEETTPDKFHKWPYPGWKWVR